MRRSETPQAALTAKQQRAIDALLREPTTQAAAEAAGVSKATIFRWLADEAFSAAYQTARGQLLESTLTALQSASIDAVNVLREVMTDASLNAFARVSAAKAVLEMGFKAREVLEVEARLSALEAELTGDSAGNTWEARTR